MEPLKSVQIRDHIVQMLREEIFSGGIADGEELAQEVVADKLGVSRMPVREAFQQLVLEGILIRLPNRHMQVAGIHPRNIRQIFSMLRAVEIEIVSILLLEDCSCAPAREAFRQYRAAVPLQGTEKCADRECSFHESLSACLQNHYLAHIHQQMIGGYFSYVLHSARREWKATLRLLNELMAALEERNSTASIKALNSYFDYVMQAALADAGENRFEK